MSPHRENTPSTVARRAAAVTQVEIAALLAVAQDHAFGQPPGSQLRATVLGQHLARPRPSVEPAERATTWWTSALRFLGCTGHAFETAVVFGDEIEIRAESMQADLANPVDVMRLMVSHAGPGKSGVRRVRSVLSVLAGGSKAAEMNFRSACEVADVFAKRLGLDEAVRGRAGRDASSGGTAAVSRPARRARRSRGRCASPSSARNWRCSLASRASTARLRSSGGGAARRTTRRSPTSSSPTRRTGGRTSSRPTPWDAALAVAPPERRRSTTPHVHESLLVLADFADLKSPWIERPLARRRGARPRCVRTRGRGGRARARPRLRRGAEHDLGQARAAHPRRARPRRDPRARDRQLLRRVPYTAALAAVACAAHERIDGSGYHRRVNGAQLDEAQRVIAAADCYQAMTSDRPHRAALSPPTRRPSCGR